jgi:DNA modification methylase
MKTKMQAVQTVQNSLYLPTEAKPCIIIESDALTVLRGFPDNTFQCCVTSPPYWGLRDYGRRGVALGKLHTGVFDHVST